MTSSPLPSSSIYLLFHHALYFYLEVETGFPMAGFLPGNAVRTALAL